MNERDELAEIVGNSLVTRNSPKQTADEILAAGYRKPRTITTVEELDALPVGTIILDSDPDACMKVEGGRWRSIDDPEETFSTSGISGSLPATVMHEGTRP